MDNGTYRYLCHYCGELFITSKTLTRHIEEVHTEDRPYKCGTCDKTFKRKFDRRRHEMTHRWEKPYQCLVEFCKQSFTHKGNLYRHVKAKHSIDKNYKCNVCEEVFKTQMNLDYHIKTKHIHERAYKCDQCSVRFTHCEHLKQHIKVHIGEKSYSCEECGKRFIHKSSLNNHRLVHTDKRNYGCEVCGNTYKRKNALVRHIQHEGHFLVIMTSNEQIDNERHKEHL